MFAFVRVKVICICRPLLRRVFAAGEAAWQLRASQHEPYRLLLHAFSAWKNFVQEHRIQLAEQQACSIAETHR